MTRLSLTPWQRRRLRREVADTADARLLRRALAVLEVDAGRPPAAVADLLGVTRQSVYNWVGAYLRAGGPAGLADRPGRGRRPVLDEDAEHFLDTLLAMAPQDLGFPHANWTVPLLQKALAIGTGLRPSDDTVRRALAARGYAWKRPRHRLEPDPEREKKTAHPPAGPGPARPQRRPGRGRDGPAAVPAPAGRLGQARGAGPGLGERPERPAGGVRGHEPADRHPAVRPAGARPDG